MGRHWYAWLIMVILFVGGLGGSTAVTLRSAQRSIDAEHAARLAAEEDSRRNAEASRQVVCAVVVAQSNVYREAATPVGAKASQAWDDLRQLFKCDGE